MFNASRFMLLAVLLSSAARAEFTLPVAIDQALQDDHWQRSNQLQEQALRSDAIAAGQLPDPGMRLALANLPTDTLKFDQENMTQLQLGLSQQFPRGDSLDIRSQQLSMEADKKPTQRLERRALIKLNVTQDWLALHQALAQRDRLLEKRHIFDELVNISRANFRTGNARRFEVLEAELQLTRLQERIVRLEEAIARQRGRLQQWFDQPLNEAIPKQMAALTPLLALDNPQALDEALSRHPQLALLQQDIEVREKGVELAEEAYKPGFRLDAGYGYRADRPDGMERSDLFTLALTMDLPLFPEKRQDARRNAAIQQREAGKELRLLKARQLRSELQVVRAELDGLKQRRTIYDRGYLQQQAAKRRAALKAYAARDARFNEVAMAALAELEVQLQKIELDHRIARSVAQVNYYLAALDPQLKIAAGKER
ncbi:TolC family protein [Neptuniibacter halophilus]|uniref:TolC family protein n=1 Tax=Neptuniibacter halophilus TaxID=651666 RepID=UPI0025730768|nr:TolC family protein [Neptuniibacter halophilus]